MQPTRRVTNIENGLCGPICQGTNSTEAFQSAHQHGCVRLMQPGKIRVTWREKHSCDSVTATMASSKSWIFLHWFNWKCGDHKQAGIREIMWPGGGNPQTAVSVIFLHLPSHPGCRQRPICFKSSTSKKNLLPRNDRVACLPDDAPGTMISALMKTSEGLILSIAECHTHPSSFYSVWLDCTRVRRSEVHWGR